MASKHIPIDTWLEALGMKEYEGVFRDFHGVEVGLHILEKIEPFNPLPDSGNFFDVIS